MYHTLAKWHTRIPLQRHWKPRFPHLNVHRLMEPVATDTVFANCKALGGDTCAQGGDGNNRNTSILVYSNLCQI